MGIFLAGGTSFILELKRGEEFDLAWFEQVAGCLGDLAQVTLYRRERWETPDGLRIIAELDPGIVGGYGPNLHRFVLALHFCGQVTCERIVALLNGMGVVISKRQVVRLLTVKLETFRAEDAAAAPIWRVPKTRNSGIDQLLSGQRLLHLSIVGNMFMSELLKAYLIWGYLGL